MSCETANDCHQMTFLTTRSAARILIINLRHRQALLLTRPAVLLGEGRPDTRERRKSSLRGPPSQRYVEVISTQIMDDAWKKNLLRLLARLHSSENQTIPSWTGFNILARNKLVVANDSVGYLPTLNAPATDMSTVYQVLTKSLQIKETLRLQNIVVVFDQALYAKAT